MAKKLYMGNLCLSLQFFQKRSVLYVHSSTFSVSVYALYHTMWLAILIDLLGKARQAMKKERGKNKHSERYTCSYYCLFNSPWAWVVLSSQREAGGGGGGEGRKSVKNDL